MYRLLLVATALLPAVTFAQQAPDKIQPRQPGQTEPQPGQTGKLPDTMKAPPFTLADKFEYRIVQSFGFRGFGGALVGAAIGQAAGSPHEWGGGVQGFTERYASGFGGNVSRQTFAWMMESTLREDPRYFPSEDRTYKRRALNALKQTVYCKTDAGNGSFAYARVISAFGNGQFVNLWQPASTGSVGDGLRRGVYTLGVDAAYNFMQEFIPFTRPISLRHRH